MVVYLIRPRNNGVIKALASRKLDPDSRQKQAEEVQENHKKNPAQKEIRSFIEDAEKNSMVRILKDLDKPGCSGVNIVDVYPDAEKRFVKDLPDSAKAGRSTRVQLIAPDVVKGSFTPTEDNLGDDELWHLRVINAHLHYNSNLDLDGSGVGIAVLDTGIDSRHPALHGKVNESLSFTEPDSVDIFSQMEFSYDSNGHGTRVAGLIAGRKVGVAPGAKLYSGSVIQGERPEGDLSQIVRAIDWVGDNPHIQIANISIGQPGYFFPEVMQEALHGVQVAGVLVVGAIGNEGRDGSCSPGNYKDVVSTGSINKQNLVSDFSGSGTLTFRHHSYSVPDMVAPGEEVYSCTIRGGYGYESCSGTSMAAPIVSGISAIVAQEFMRKYGTVDNFQLKEELIRRCKRLETEEALRQGHGALKLTKG